MNQVLATLLEAEKLLSSSYSFSEIEGLITGTIKTFGFDKFFYGIWNSNQPFSQFDVEFGEYPAHFANHKEKCFLRTEPVIKYCLDNTVPLIWDGETILNKNSHSVEEFLGEYPSVVPKHYIPAGVLVPLHKVYDEIGLVYLWSETACDAACIQKISQCMPFILMLAIHVHDAVTRIYERIKDKNVKLTKREIQCLQCCQAGKTYKEISRSLGISERTVVFHIGNLFRKLGVKNKTQALSKTHHLGIMKSYPTSII